MVKDFGYFIIETNKCVEAFRDNFRYSIQQVETLIIGFGVMEKLLSLRFNLNCKIYILHYQEELIF
jgi:hypothetical protein